MQNMFSFGIQQDSNPNQNELFIQNTELQANLLNFENMMSSQKQPERPQSTPMQQPL